MITIYCNVNGDAMEVSNVKKLGINPEPFVIFSTAQADIYINQEQAELLILHLQNQFNL